MFSRAFHRRYGVNPREVNRTFEPVAIREKGATPGIVDPDSVTICGYKPRTGTDTVARLKRQKHVECLLTVARLLHIGDLAAAAVTDPSLGDFVQSIVLSLWMSSGRTMPAISSSRISLLILHFLSAFDHQVAVRQ